MQKNDYNATINLPKTEFPMRAGLPKREPELLSRMEDATLYERLMEKNKDKPLWILHDGPPYANGDIHLGHALNHILKDFVVRYRNMSGHLSPYVPGWDTHGLPIESQIIKKTGLDRDKISVAEFRDLCRDFALGFVDVHREQLKRLGCVGEWDNPYLTLTPDYEARQIEVFGEMFKKGLIYKGLKPVYWCPHDQTALAEAEIEYHDDPCKTIYVKFRVHDDHGKLGTDLTNTYFLIWTTTTWTLPGNMAITLGADFDYALVKVPSGEIYIIAKELVEPTMQAGGISEYEIIREMKGAEFKRMTAHHPFIDRDSLILLGDHVTLDAGTGCVHTAGAHGLEDFDVSKKYGVDIVVPIDERGIFTKDAAPFDGMYFLKANGPIEKNLEESGALFASTDIVHSYPHCWRCRESVLFRATEQWFVSVDAIKEEAVEAVRNIKWFPAWGEERMVNMVRERADWCISRQRNWGVPIPIFYCADCGEPLINDDTIQAVVALFREKGSNGWYTDAPEDILPGGMSCPKCGHTSFTKETDIMDVWFDSGSSHYAVLEERDNLRRPADLYLEGGDQYRGWFQSSLLTSIATTGKAPYKNVVTHGWTVDGEGKKMSKSIGNNVYPMEMVEQYGADILRLWVSSVDFKVDMRISKEIFKQLSDIYLKIRNTARYILGNLEGFDPDAPVPASEMLELDRWALHRLNLLIEKVQDSYESYEYHLIYHAVHNFCVVDMSNFYLDIIKDRLYCEAPGSLARRSAQTAMYKILDALVRLISPILAFTSEEIWQFMPHGADADKAGVLLNDMPTPDPAYTLSPELGGKFDFLLALRGDVNKALELARAEKLIGKPLEAKVTLTCDGEMYDKVALYLDELPAICIVSAVALERGGGENPGELVPGVSVAVSRAPGEKCGRCWCMSEELGRDASHPSLCPRCTDVVLSL